MICEKCGAQNPEYAKVCGNCHQQLASAQRQDSVIWRQQYALPSLTYGQQHGYTPPPNGQFTPPHGQQQQGYAPPPNGQFTPPYGQQQHGYAPPNGQFTSPYGQQQQGYAPPNGQFTPPYGQQQQGYAPPPYGQFPPPYGRTQPLYVPPYPQYYYAYQQKRPGAGFATASLVLGIISICLVGWLYGIVAIVLGANAKRLGYTGAKATAGIVLGIIGIVLSVIILAGIYSYETYIPAGGSNIGAHQVVNFLM